MYQLTLPLGAFSPTPTHKPAPTPAPAPQEIQAAREKAGLSRAEIARRLGVTQIVYTNWETGHCSTKDPRHLRALRRLIRGTAAPAPLRAPAPAQIQAARHAARLTHAAAAARLGVTPTVYTNWETGRCSTKRPDKIKLLWRLVQEHPEETPTGE